MHGFIDVTKRQLKDVLPGWKFSEEASLELRRSMTHCKLTNLISEHALRDLDYSQYRRRHASLHFHSSIQMVKRNKTISVWLNSKSIVTARPMTDLCWTCQRNNTYIYRSANLPEADNNERVIQQERHLLVVQRGRSLYNMVRHAKDVCHELGISELTEFHCDDYRIIHLNEY